MVTPAMADAMIGPMYSLRKAGPNMAAMGFVCASLLFRALPYIKVVPAMHTSQIHKKVEQPF